MKKHLNNGGLPKVKGIDAVVGLQAQNELKRVLFVHLPVLADAALDVDTERGHSAAHDIHATPHRRQHHSAVGGSGNGEGLAVNGDLEHRRCPYNRPFIFLLESIKKSHFSRVIFICESV